TLNRSSRQRAGRARRSATTARAAATIRLIAARTACAGPSKAAYDVERYRERFVVRIVEAKRACARNFIRGEHRISAHVRAVVPGCARSLQTVVCVRNRDLA